MSVTEALYDEVRGLEKSRKECPNCYETYSEDSFRKSLVREDGSVVGDELEEAVKPRFRPT